MKASALVLLVSLLSLLSPNAYAEGEQKHLNVGIGTYALTVAYDNPFIIDDDYSGTVISVFYAPTDQFAFRGGIYSTEHDSLSALENNGYDLAIYLGTGLATQGFKAYVGGGIFNETQEAFGFNKDFGGVQLSGGIGYNWDAIALDFILGIRDPGDYEDFVGVDAAAVTGSLILSIRI